MASSGWLPLSHPDLLFSPIDAWRTSLIDIFCSYQHGYPVSSVEAHTPIYKISVHGNMAFPVVRGGGGGGGQKDKGKDNHVERPTTDEPLGDPGVWATWAWAGFPQGGVESGMPISCRLPGPPHSANAEKEEANDEGRDGVCQVCRSSLPGFLSVFQHQAFCQGTEYDDGMSITCPMVSSLRGQCLVSVASPRHQSHHMSIGISSQGQTRPGHRRYDQTLQRSQSGNFCRHHQT